MKKRPSISQGYVLPVKHALQDHPESPPLWTKMIDGILRANGFVPTIHEPCLYSANIYGHKIFFLRQVDDFAVSAPTREITVRGFSMIQNKLTEPLKMFDKLNL